MNLAAMIEDHPAERVALMERDRTLTYGELRARVGSLRGALVERGIARGDRVRLRIGDAVRSAVVVGAYGTLGPGQVGLVVDSYGLLAVCLDRRSAADELGLGPADPVVLEPIPDDESETPAPAPVAFPQRR